MNLSCLEEIPTQWERILVIGRTMERDKKKYHIIGMSAGSELRLYIIEPFHEPEAPVRRNSRRRHRNQLKEPGIRPDKIKDAGRQCRLIKTFRTGLPNDLFVP